MLYRVLVFDRTPKRQLKKEIFFGIVRFMSTMSLELLSILQHWESVSQHKGNNFQISVSNWINSREITSREFVILTRRVKSLPNHAFFLDSFGGTISAH